MRSRSFLVVVGVVIVLLAGAGAVLAYDSSQRHTIADGIKIGGVNVGGMSAGAASAKLNAAYQTRLADPLVLAFHRHRFVLHPRAAHVSVDVAPTVQQALERSRSDNIFVRTFRSITGGAIHDEIDPQTRYSPAAVSALVAHVTHSLNNPARDASISYTGNSIHTVDDHTGIAVSASRLTQAIDAALLDPRASRVIRIPVATTQPKLTTHELAARYPTIITVDRSAFTLRLWRHLHLAKSYPIAVGMQGLETPAGLYHVQDKAVNPSWQVPNSAWAGSLAGQTIPPGPQDPIKARWMGIYNGAGIHGTDELDSLGSAASHGCIRMAIPDVIDLYNQTPVGAPVYIA
jgi:lipoprotein-anchoring transpeptidase ErfK/SrfK